MHQREIGFVEQIQRGYQNLVWSLFVTYAEKLNPEVWGEYHRVTMLARSGCENESGGTAYCQGHLMRHMNLFRHLPKHR
jgi:hypothetical protein